MYVADQYRVKKRAATEQRTTDYATDPVAWANDVLDFHPDPIQQQVLDLNIRRGLLNCTRQWGKSTTTALKALHHAAHNPASLIIVTSHSQRQSGEFITKARAFARKAGFRVRGDGENRSSILLPNNSRLIGLPDLGDTTRGFSGASLLIIDEAARVSEEMYEAVRPMLAVSQGALWMMSTPRGKQGFFYRAWSSPDPVGQHWTRIQVAAAQCPRIPSRFLDEERLVLGEQVFRQEYGCEFVSAIGSLFDEVLLRSKVSAAVPSLW